MKLGLTYKELEDLFGSEVSKLEGQIDLVSIDSRRIIDGEHTLFVALKGDFRDGHQFISDSYKRGVRAIILEELPAETNDDCLYIQVDDSLKALQKLAFYHRQKFDIPVIAITGSAGKTIVKEWLGQLLSTKYRTVRSPKSYNSQIGVALSLLEIRPDTQIAIIEAGISQPGEMAILERMIKPTHGIFTSLGSAHLQNFRSKEEQLKEKMILFENVSLLIANRRIPIEPLDHIKQVDRSDISYISSIPFHTTISEDNASLAVEMARAFDIEEQDIQLELTKLEPVVLRMETFDGIMSSIIINDSYNLDTDAFRSSLEYQLAIANGKKRIVLLGTKDPNKVEELSTLIDEFQPIDLQIISDPSIVKQNIENSVVLIKGSRDMHMEKHASLYRLKKHTTYVEIDLNAIRSNVNTLKKRLPAETKILAMVKAASYGSGADKMALFLERLGVNYLGVAYADEGVELRRAGVKLPIMVMNAEVASFLDCIDNQLEPAIFSINQLQSFIKELIYKGKKDYPIHVTLETGMNRLGFDSASLPQLVELINAQPEVKIQSVYSHLATADEADSSFVHDQANKFEKSANTIGQGISYHFDRHLLNSAGVVNFPEYHLDMVRLGIGMYGYLDVDIDLIPSIKWKSSISQIKAVQKDQSIGYSRAMIAEKDMQIAVVPIGYADGFRRTLSNGVGEVFISGTACPVVGNVCMDMIMVDVTGLAVSEGDPVEIVGEHQSINALARKMRTIAYEVMTSISKRVHRIYTEE